MPGAYRPILIDAVREIIAQFLALELHAARAGREVMRVLVETARCSSASETTALAAEIRFAVDAILQVMPPYAPALNVMHRILARVEEALRAGEREDALRAGLEEQAECLSALVGDRARADSGVRRQLDPGRRDYFHLHLERDGAQLSTLCGRKWQALLPNGHRVPP